MGLTFTDRWRGVSIFSAGGWDQQVHAASGAQIHPTEVSGNAGPMFIPWAISHGARHLTRSRGELIGQHGRPTRNCIVNAVHVEHAMNSMEEKYLSRLN